MSVRGFANAVAEFPEGVMGPSPSSEAADRPISGSAGQGSSPSPPSRQRGAVSQASSGSPVGLSTGRRLRSATVSPAANRVGSTRPLAQRVQAAPVPEVSPAANRVGSTRLLVPAGGGRLAISAKSRLRRGALPVVRHGGSADLRFGRAGLADSPRTPGGAPRSRQRPPAARWVSRRAGGSGRRRGLAPRIGRVRRDSSSRPGGGGRRLQRNLDSVAPRSSDAGGRPISGSARQDWRTSPALPAARRAFTGIPRRPGGFLDGPVAPVGEGVSRRESGEFDATPPPGWGWPVIAGEGGGGRRSPRCGGAPRRPRQRVGRSPVSSGPGLRPAPHSRRRGAFSQASRGSPVGLPTGRWLRSAKGFRAAKRSSPTRLPVPAGGGGRRSRRAVGTPRGGQPEAASEGGPVGIVAPPVRDSRHSCFGRVRRRRRAARAGVGRAGC